MYVSLFCSVLFQGILTVSRFSCRITNARKGRALPIHTVGGPATPPERGCCHADYIDVSCIECHCDDHGKKQAPPLGQVTASYAYV